MIVRIPAGYIVTAMRAPTLLIIAALLAFLPWGALRAAEDAPALPAQVEVPPMKTSIYVGSVTLRTTAFVRSGDTWAATYEARVFPWAFWSEHGEITIRVPESDLARLIAGEMVEFTGDARNHRGRARVVTGRARPAETRAGEIKVRIRVDGAELVFNGTYTLADAPQRSLTGGSPGATGR